jgi:hypothetical protein
MTIEANDDDVEGQVLRKRVVIHAPIRRVLDNLVDVFVDMEPRLVTATAPGCR